MLLLLTLWYILLTVIVCYFQFFLDPFDPEPPALQQELPHQNPSRAATFKLNTALTRQVSAETYEVHLAWCFHRALG